MKHASEYCGLPAALNDLRYDVVVGGGGPAGIGAAVSAARAGARTLLVEATNCLGGMIGNVQISSFGDSPGGPVFEDLARRLLELDAAHWRINPERFRPPGRLRYHPETARAVALELVIEAGADVLLGTFAERALTKEKRVTGVVLATKSGSLPVSAKVVIDCTADADIAASVGASFEQGDPEDGRIQVCNFRWQIGGVDNDRFRRERPADERLEQLFKQAVQDGRIRPPEALFAQDAGTFPFDRQSGGLGLNAWELQGINPTDPMQTSRALAQCQLAALQIVRFCRANLPGYEKCIIERFPTSLGTRESRRIIGHYTITREDIIEGRKFFDGVVKAWFWIDFHDPPPGRTVPHGLEYVKANQPPPGDWYEIPYRCLLPRNISGLLVAGRCISCDRAALAALRIMPTCMFLGTAAGTAAAWAARDEKLPENIEGRRLKQALLS
ncbi:MAG: FAD-dependent oxidoreductase [Kiritimatiellia bacterium]|nr:FAD-dependent oxidoreductase [Kiritimatiellia bacterium]